MQQQLQTAIIFANIRVIMQLRGNSSSGIERQNYNANI
jgi:hypothetical protein